VYGFELAKEITATTRRWDVLKEFERSLERRKPSTIRLYVAGAKAAIKAAKVNVLECGSYAELLALIREAQPEKGVRIAPFLRFLERGGEGELNKSVAREAVRGIQYWVIQAFAKRMRREKNPSIASRRDMALIASLCLAPKGNPRNWARNCLKITGAQVILWDKRVEEPVFALALRFWHAWRERLTRPDQRRLYRRPREWSHSELLFPGPRGRPLARAALHNALRRLLSGVGEARRLTPLKIRAAFLAGEPLTAGSGLLQGGPPEAAAPL
jgi:hypothetical protein